MNQLSAHLDRGWDLIQRGDLRGARTSARRALEHDRNSPEALNLLGYVTAMEGDPEEALEHFRQAMALDDGYIDPILHAAELLAFHLNEWDEAIALCDDVLEFAEGKEEIIDAMVLKIDALLGKGDLAGARAQLLQMPEPTEPSPGFSFLVGRAWFEVGDVARAGPLLTKAAQEEPDNPDVQLYIGLAHEAAGRPQQAALAFLLTRLLDLQIPRPAWTPSKEAFQQMVERAMAKLEPALSKHLREASIFIVEVPGVEVVAEGMDPRMPVMFDGPMPQKPEDPIATRVFIYQFNVERMCNGIDQIEEEIGRQISEEIRHALTHVTIHTVATDRPTARPMEKSRAPKRTKPAVEPSPAEPEKKKSKRSRST